MEFLYNLFSKLSLKSNCQQQAAAPTSPPPPPPPPPPPQRSLGQNQSTQHGKLEESNCNELCELFEKLNYYDQGTSTSSSSTGVSAAFGPAPFNNNYHNNSNINNSDTLNDMKKNDERGDKDEEEIVLMEGGWANDSPYLIVYDSE